MKMTVEIDLDPKDFDDIMELEYQQVFILQEAAIFVKHTNLSEIPGEVKWEYMMGSKVVARMIVKE